MKKILLVGLALSLWASPCLAAQETILGGSGVLWGDEKVKVNSNFTELYGKWSLFDAYTMLYADTDNTPAALSITANTIPGRLAAGIVALPVDASGDCAAGSACFGGHTHSTYETAWGTVTTRDADATPLVADHGIYSLTNTGALTVTDFVDADGDHSDFVDGDMIGVLLTDGDITLDCSENANMECFAGNDYTGSATQLTMHFFTFDATRWVGPSMPMSSPTTMVLKTVQAGLNVITDNDGRALTLAELNSIVLTSGAADYDIPTGSCDDATEYGVWVTLKATGVVAPSLTSADASDLFVLANGTALDAGDELDLAGASGNSCYVVCTGSHTWRVMGEVGTCADGGAAD